MPRITNSKRTALRTHHTQMPSTLIFLLILLLSSQTSATRHAKPSSFIKSRLTSSERTSVYNLCDTSHCNTCTSACPSYDALNAERASCRKNFMGLARARFHYSMYQKCLAGRCDQVVIDHACGLFDVDTDKGLLPQILAEKEKTMLEAETVAKDRILYYNTHVKNSSVTDYYKSSLFIIEECNLLFENALKIREHYFKLLDYIASIDYRIVNQEVTRIRFENEDLHRHLDFWQKQNETLFLAVQTSPRALQEARNTLHAAMKSYEGDALLMGMLQNATMTKEERAQLVITLKAALRDELQLLEERNAQVEKETFFITSARREVYNLLRNIWKKVKRDQVEVKCGSDTLSDAVANAFKSENA